MLKCPNIRNITLQQRLSQLVGRSIEINAAGLALEPGTLQKVCKSKFIRVQGELIIPKSLNFMRVFPVQKTKKTERVGVRTTFKANDLFFNIPLVQVGRDFIELQGKTKFAERLFIPLDKVEGMFEIN